MYLATVMLNRTEQEFWRMVPRKLMALHDKHLEVNGLIPKETNQEQAITDIMGW